MDVIVKLFFPPITLVGPKINISPDKITLFSQEVFACQLNVGPFESIEIKIRNSTFPIINDCRPNNKPPRTRDFIVIKCLSLIVICSDCYQQQSYDPNIGLVCYQYLPRKFFGRR